MIIYFNPDCSKCSEALELLNGAGCEVKIRNYLETPPQVEELRDLVKKLGCKPADIVRKKEELYQQKFAGTAMNDEGVLRMLCENPILIERPILVSGDRAIIGRPPSLVLEILP
jgi:arsenate reductase